VRLHVEGLQRDKEEGGVMTYTVEEIKNKINPVAKKWQVSETTIRLFSFS
jgi:hypothetical protein